MGVIIAVNSSSAPNPEEPAEKEARGMISTHEHEVNVIHTLLYAAFLHYYHAILFVLETFTCIVFRCVKPTTPTHQTRTRSGVQGIIIRRSCIV